MSKRIIAIVAVCIGLVGGFLLNNRLSTVQGQAKAGAGFAAIPGLKGGQDTFGPYDPVPKWRKPITAAYPELAGWDYSQATDVYADSTRVIVLQKGLLPEIKEGRGGVPETWLPQIGPGLKFPVGGGLPLRETASASPSCGDVPRPKENINCPMPAKEGAQGRPNIDWTWKHIVVEFDKDGNVNKAASDIWAQYDKTWGRPHDVQISPYDPEKHVWIVDADNHFVKEFTNDGSKVLLTLGTPGYPGTDDKHFARPTFMAFLDKNTFYLDDGYDGTRVIKYDMSGKKLLQWGEKGDAGGKETRPGYMNNVHGIALNPVTHRVYINDRGNNRIQVFDENGKYIDSWKMNLVTGAPSNIHDIYMGSNGILWAADQLTHKMLAYDGDGHFLYSFGTFGTCEGCLWGVHGFGADKDGNFWSASVRDGRVQKMTPRQGANPGFLLGKPWNRNF